MPLLRSSEQQHGNMVYLILPLDTIYHNPGSPKMKGKICVCVCVYFQPPVRAVCPNNEVVVFQTWIGTAPELGSVAN